jgi:hypothetical protein
VKVTLFSCGPVANESELLAFKHLDIVAIGPPGVCVIEVKHWTSQWVDAHSDLVVHEAEKVTEKARKIGTTLRRLVPDLPRVDGSILLTPEPSKLKRLAGNEIRGVTFYSLNEWKTAMALDSPGAPNSAANSEFGPRARAEKCCRPRRLPSPVCRIREPGTDHVQRRAIPQSL